MEDVGEEFWVVVYKVFIVFGRGQGEEGGEELVFDEGCFGGVEDGFIDLYFDVSVGYCCYDCYRIVYEGLIGVSFYCEVFEDLIWGQEVMCRWDDVIFKDV